MGDVIQIKERGSSSVDTIESESTNEARELMHISCFNENEVSLNINSNLAPSVAEEAKNRFFDEYINVEKPLKPETDFEIKTY